MKKLLIIISIFILIFSLVGCGSNTKGKEQVKEEKQQALLEIGKFNEISLDELVKIMGEPTEKENVNLSVTPSKKIPIIYYNYKKSDMYLEFLIYNGKIVRLNLHSPTYYDSKKPNFHYQSYQELFELFGVPKESNPELIVKTPEVLRFKPVEKFGEVYILGDTEKKTFWLAKITYDLSAFK